MDTPIQFSAYCHSNASQIIALDTDIENRYSVVTVAHAGNFFSISASGSDLSDSPLTEYQSLLEGLVEGSQEDKNGPGDLVEQWMIKPAIPLIAELTKKVLPETQTTNLAEYFNREIVCLKLKSPQGRLLAVKEQTDRLSLLSDFPKFTPSQWKNLPKVIRAEGLILTWNPLDHKAPHYVDVRDRSSRRYFLQITERARTRVRENRGKSVTMDRILYEGRVLQAIKQNSSQKEPINIPTVHGYVQAGENIFVGLLLDYIDGEALQDWIWKSPTRAQRREIMKKLEDQVRRINRTHVVPGLHPLNILIDKHTNVWLTDFAYPAADGQWTDIRRTGTLKGNLQALDRIRDCLDLPWEHKSTDSPGSYGMRLFEDAPDDIGPKFADYGLYQDIPPSKTRLPQLGCKVSSI